MDRKVKRQRQGCGELREIANKTGCPHGLTFFKGPDVVAFALKIRAIVSKRFT
jgi:hypothetical protein